MSRHTVRLRADARRNREQVIAAAREVFLAQGVDAPLEEIARRAGVGIATLYRRFPDRRTLIREVSLDAMALAAAQLRAARAEEDDEWAALVRFFHAVLETRIGTVLPVLLGSLGMEFSPDDELWASRSQLVAELDELVRAAQRTGRLRADVGVGDVMLGLLKLLRPLPSMRLLGDFTDTLNRRHAELFIDGLRGPAVPRPVLAGPAITAEVVDRYLAEQQRTAPGRQDQP
ncbi:TetR/AcrR family transcriptional regulator [Goodfellowiella coeruleoviolacea]|uniref:Transcriptional regulator, TetR family n=1 Tax=Goodfellowiella coeruleoviolacea TaxID=334858 RepID=A0AAE3G912_9PSEU|nr:TetR/AcrR family transcriptional regulator [Goodfellowiella coeruleoviolacea]MCP2163892.1 transcriptional regulator, TetR family [Goodfellowiella coeruleoviolacea]